MIVDAWVRVRERPTQKISCGVAYNDFAAGAEAVREISQSGLNPANCRLLDPVESEVTSRRTARQGAAGARLRVGARPRRGADVAGARYLPQPRRRAGRTPAERSGRTGAAGPERGAGAVRTGAGPRQRLAPCLPVRPLPPGFSGRLRRPLGHLRDGDHLGPLPRLPRRGDGDGPACGRRGQREQGRGPRRASHQLPLHPRLSRWTGPVLHGAGAGPARGRGRPVGRDQGGASRRP